MRFVVIVPAYNRADYLPEALDSLLAQTHKDWECCVLDDGSTDGTYEVAQFYVARDRRFSALRFPENRGSSVMNNVGMEVALSSRASAWTRLGSDDAFAPHKLALDVWALEHGCEACYGPYRVRHTTYLDETLYSEPQDATGMLRSGGFAASWASVAVRISVLRRVLGAYGGFSEPRALRMDDWLCNARIATLAEFEWRGLRRDGTAVLGARSWEEAGGEMEDFHHDAFWRVNAASNSTDAAGVAADAKLTRDLLAEDMVRVPHSSRPPRLGLYVEHLGVK